MGCACPVCGSPQADGEHLANHLAFTALLHGGDHEAWLDEHVPDWADRDPDGLAGVVVEHAEEIEHETVFEDASGTRGDVPLHDSGATADSGEFDPETRRIVEEAREMTRQRRSGDERGRPDEEQ